MSKEDRFERYTPQHPLPADITNMSRQDTVCQFCGVSYLIHNEIKALEEKCQKLEADLAYYAGISSRENALEQQLQNKRSHISDLESTISINTHKINEFTRKLQLAQVELEQSESAHQETKKSFSKYSFKLQALHDQLEKLRKEYVSLRDFYSNDIQNWKTYFQTTKQMLQREMRTIMDKYTTEINICRTDIERYQEQLKEVQHSLHDLQVKHQQVQFESNESQIITRSDLEAAQGEIEIQKNEISSLREQLYRMEQSKTQQENDFERTKQYLQQVERQLSDKEQSQRNNDLLIDQYRQQLNTEKELRLQSDAELENLRSEFSQLNSDYEALKELETNESHNRRKVDDMNRTRQAVLDRTRDEYEKLLRKYNDLDEVYNELVTLRENDASELKTIKHELERLHNDNVELARQRETFHITHDIQIKKLHDTYSTKLREAEQWPDRLQYELNREREHHRVQMHELEQRLKESYLAELNIERQKYNGLLRKYEQESSHSSEKLRHELLSTEKVTIEQRNYYTKQIEQLERENENLKKELDELRDVLKDLHEQLNKRGALNNDHGNSLKLREELLAKETHLFEAKATIDELQKCLEQTREEMTTLQETVHKECTEREQLKDALIDARQQLLAFKKNSVLNGPVSRSLHSPPVAFENLEKQVTEPLSYAQRYHRNKVISGVQSEPTIREDSIAGDAADFVARSMSTSKKTPYHQKVLPPIHHSQQRRNGNSMPTNKSDPLLENQRRITRFIKLSSK